MENRIKNITAVSLFIIIIFGFMIGNIVMPDNEISYSERRTLARFPDFSGQEILQGVFFSKFEKYALDQFVSRDDFRSLKAFMVFSILRQRDYNGVYIVTRT